LFTYSIDYWEVYRHFQGGVLVGGWGGGSLSGRIFLWRNFSWGKGVSHEGGAEFPVLFKK